VAVEVKTASISREEVLSLSVEILQSVGTPPDYAASIAESLVQAQEVGHASHGIIRLLEYTDSVKRDVIDPGVRPTIFRDEGAVAIVDSHWGWGQIACKYAVEVVSKKAKKYGISIVSIKDCNHIGRVGEYVELLAAQNLISMMWCNADPAVAAFGGKDRLFGTNPLAVGIPSNDLPVVIDFATAASAEGKLRVARANGSSIPLGTVIDSEGQESTDPNDFYEGGALLPFGGHKGYCLSLMIELLGGTLSGNHPSMNAGYTHGYGTVLLAIDPDKFFGDALFKNEISEATHKIRATTPTKSDQPVLVPGDVENNQRKLNTPIIQISETIWNSVKDLRSNN
jgi:hydroxycarboxylate dehydrogenase B